jgi:hypothetical protein
VIWTAFSWRTTTRRGCLASSISPCEWLGSAAQQIDRSSRLRRSSELDDILFGSTEMAERYFNLCVAILEVIIKQIVAEFPKQVRGLNGFLSRHVRLCAEGWCVRPCRSS